MKELIKEYFIFQKSDRNGILLLAALLVMLIVLPHSFSYIYVPQQNHSDEFKDKVAAILPYLEEGRKKQFNNKTTFYDKKETFKKKPSDHKGKKPLPPPFTFDPNKLTVEKSMKLGFSEKQAKVIENYLRKGGTFYKKENFKKLYVVDDKMYKHLEGFIKIPAKEYVSKKKDKVYKKKEFNDDNPNDKKSFTKEIVWNLKPFDPNQLNKETAVAMGFPDKMAKIIENYLSKGGVFKEADDLSKIYGMTPEIMETVKPFIQLSTKVEQTIEKEPEIASAPICINTANKDQLVGIPGIGPFFSRAIIEHREKLGGYVATEQLMEIYKMDQEKYDAIAQYVTIDKQATQGINLNTADYKTLRNHPYIEHTIAKGLINYRKQHGDFINISDIRQSYLIDEVLYQKIAPYLTVK